MPGGDQVPFLLIDNRQGATGVVDTNSQLL